MGTTPPVSPRFTRPIEEKNIATSSLATTTGLVSTVQIDRSDEVSTISITHLSLDSSSAIVTPFYLFEVVPLSSEASVLSPVETIQQDLPTLPNEGPLQRLNFENVNESLAPSLVGAHSWENIPPFAIITGANGVGKSQLLSHIRASLLPLTKEGGHCLLYKPSSLIQNASDGSYQESFLDYHELKSRANLEYVDIPDTEIGKTKLIIEIRQILQETSTNKTPPGRFDKIAWTAWRFANENEGRVLNTITDEEIWQCYVRPSVVSLSSNANVFNLLEDIFWSYYLNRLNLKRTYASREYYATLYSLYEEEYPDKKSGMTCDHIRQNPQYFDNLLDYVVRKNIGIPPWEEINLLFKHNNLDLRVDCGPFNSEEQMSDTRIEYIFFRRDNKRIDSKQLSSGERLILEMLTWQYYNSGLSSNSDKKAEVMGVDIILLDEPDRHFDPDLCKLFMSCLKHISEKNKIQIIMTTHRTDTLAYAPEGSIFTIKREGDSPARIEATPRLNALFRLTPNLRDITNFHIKVYTESHDDATFYERVYRQLLTLSAKQREKGKMSLEIKPTILSRRFQLSFYSLAMVKTGDGGGCDAITKTVVRDIEALKNMDEFDGNDECYSKKIAIPREITYPFGVVDADRDLDKDRNILPTATRIQPILDQIKPQIVFTKRYSLENYLYDPALLFSLLSEQEINDWFTKDDDFREYARACYLALPKSNVKTIIDVTSIQAAFDNYFRYFLEKFISSEKQRTDAEKYNLSYGYLTRFIAQPKANTVKEFIFIDQLMADLNIHFTNQETEEEKRKKIVDGLMKKSQTEEEKIKIFTPDGLKSYSIEYPDFFIYARGHTLENFLHLHFICAANESPGRITFKKWLINKIAVSPKPLTLPVDLVNLIRELNRNVRAQAHISDKYKVTVEVHFRKWLNTKIKSVAHILHFIEKWKKCIDELREPHINTPVFSGKYAITQPPEDEDLLQEWLTLQIGCSRDPLSLLQGLEVILYQLKIEETERMAANDNATAENFKKRLKNTPDLLSSLENYKNLINELKKSFKSKKSGDTAPSLGREDFQSAFDKLKLVDWSQVLEVLNLPTSVSCFVHSKEYQAIEAPVEEILFKKWFIREIAIRPQPLDFFKQVLDIINELKQDGNKRAKDSSAEKKLSCASSSVT